MIAKNAMQISNAAGDTAIVSLYGAQVLSWRTASGDEHLYCSPQADVVSGRATRGGVPICFPQFGNFGPLIKHGFARTSVWQPVGSVLSGPSYGIANAHFSMQESESSRAVWPYKFLLNLAVNLGPAWIEICLTVTNTGSEVFDFTAALHSYLAVADVRLVTIHGLNAAPYLDALKGNVKVASAELPLVMSSEIDRVYLGTTKPLKIAQDKQTTLQINQQGFKDTVVWNPGPVKAAALGDMPASDWVRMLCVEAVQV